MQTQENSPAVGYRPPLFPGSAELAELAELAEQVPESEVEEPEKTFVDDY